jgi:hypothetical protein
MVSRLRFRESAGFFAEFAPQRSSRRFPQPKILNFVAAEALPGGLLPLFQPFWTDPRRVGAKVLSREACQCRKKRQK